MSNQRAIVIHPVVKSVIHKNRNHLSRSPDERLQEATGLALAIDLEVVIAQVIPLSAITPATFLGSGKVQELADYIQHNDVDLAIIDEHITPVQQRNLEKAFKCKVIDRTALILEIFGQRAQTKEGRLQVELAAFEYQKSRLVRSWTHLERQRGGGGFLGGPGERQIESDRRAIRERISVIKKQLDKVVKTRQLHRKSRQKIPYPVVALVGYTNAGKSTLFNQLTTANVVAEDKLFATLDPTMRLIKLPSGKKIILSDTVGFISELPTELIAAFRATLEEVTEADLLLHVRDVSHADSEAQKQDVTGVLSSLVSQKKIENDTIEVFNKIDLLDLSEEDNLYEKAKQTSNTAAVSALEDIGLDYLLKLIDIKLSEGHCEIKVDLDVANGQMLAWAYQHAKVLDRKDTEGTVQLTLLISDKDLGKFNKLMGLG